MTVPASLPGSQQIAAWWRDLTVWRPRRLWFADLHVHAVEALVSVTRSETLDPLSRSVLRTLGSNAGPASTADLSERLSLDRQFAARLLNPLQDANLIRLNGADRWTLTETGRAGFAGMQWSMVEQRRRVFHFLDNCAVGGTLQFIALTLENGQRHTSESSGAHFDTALISECIARPLEWKRARHFPEDVREVHLLTIQSESEKLSNSTAWRHIVVDTPMRVRLALAMTENDRLLGFALFSDGTIRAEHPALAIEASAQEVFPDLDRDASSEVSRRIVPLAVQ